MGLIAVWCDGPTSSSYDCSPSLIVPDRLMCRLLAGSAAWFEGRSAHECGASGHAFGEALLTGMSMVGPADGREEQGL